MSSPPAPRAPQLEFYRLARHVTDQNLEPDSQMAAQARQSFKAGWIAALAEVEALRAQQYAGKLLAKSLTDGMIDAIRADWGNTNAAVLRQWRDAVLVNS